MLVSLWRDTCPVCSGIDDKEGERNIEGPGEGAMSDMDCSLQSGEV